MVSSGPSTHLLQRGTFLKYTEIMALMRGALVISTQAEGMESESEPQGLNEA